MKTLPLLLISTARLLAGPVPCHDLIGFQGFNGAVPQCFLDASGQASIVLNGGSRLDWQNLHLVPGTGLTSLTIQSGGHAVAIVDGGTLTKIDGVLASDSRLGLFSRQIVIGTTGQISAPELVVSALPPANADVWITTGSTTLTQAPGSLGQVVNHGVVRATEGPLTVVGTTVQNGNEGETSPVMQARGDLHATAGGSVVLNGAEALAQGEPAVGLATINNFGSLSGFSVHLRAIPHYDPATSGFIQINITNGGIIASNASGSGVHLNTIHPNQPVVGYTALRPGSQIFTPNPAAWPTSANVQTLLFNDGEVLAPQEDDAPTAPAAPLAIPKLSGSGVVAADSSAPALAATYSSLNSLPKRAAATAPAAQNASVATRGTPEKQKRGALVKGAFFQLKYRN